jgi:uracil-DNA glycosylase family 4
MNPFKELRNLRDNWNDCSRCSLSKLRGSKDILFGKGKPTANFLFVLGPPSEEDITNGTILSDTNKKEIFKQLLQGSGINSEDTYLAPLVACRPFVVLPATVDSPEQIRDRAPSKAEVDACKERIQRIIYTLDPRIIIAMGDTAWKMLVPPKGRGHINTSLEATGRLYEILIQGKIHPLRYPVMAALSLEHIARDPSDADHGPLTITMKALQHAEKYVSWVKKAENDE